MTFGRNRRLILAGILVIAFCLRLAIALWWQDRLGDARGFGLPDSDSYWYLARKIAAGQSYAYGGPEFRVFRAPGYPILLAGLFSVVGDNPPVVWARALGAVLGTLSVGGVVWLGRSLFDWPTAFLAGFFAAVYPGAIGMSVFVLAEALFCPLMIVQLGCWVMAWKAETAVRRGLWAVLTGVLAGFAVLTRPSWLLFVPMVLGSLAVFSANRRRHLGLGFWILLAICITMLPWWVRNYRAVGRFVPTTLQVGASLYDGLNPDATGASHMSFSAVFYQAQKRADAEAGRSIEGFEVRLDQRLRDAAFDWARAHPGAVIELMGRKCIRMWNVWPNAAEFRSWPLRVIVATGYMPLLILGLVGTWKWARGGWPFVLCLLPAAYFTCLHVIFVSSIRYREPAMLAWIVLSAATVATALGWRGSLSGGLGDEIGQRS